MMKRPHQLLQHFRNFPSLCGCCRTYATSYSGHIVQHGTDGRTIAIEVEPPTLVRDVRGYALPRRDLVCHVLKILHSSDSIDPFLDLSQYLQTLTITLTTSEVSEILKSLRNPQKALNFFHFSATSIPGLRHDSFTYNRILTILAKSTPIPFNVVNQIIDEMEHSDVGGSISTVNILIGIFGTAGEIQRCLDLAKKWHLRFNSYTYKCLLQAYLRSNEVTKAFGVFEDVRRRGYKLDIFAYNMLLDLLAKDEKVHFL